MTVTKTDLSKIPGEVSCATQVVTSGAGKIYLGTNKGIVYVYNVVSGAVTELQRLPGAITAIICDAATYIYIGTNKGIIYRYTLSGGALTVLYTDPANAIAGLTMYSSKLYGSLSGGKIVSITVS